MGRSWCDRRMIMPARVPCSRVRKMAGSSFPAERVGSRRMTFPRHRLSVPPMMSQRQNSSRAIGGFGRLCVAAWIFCMASLQAQNVVLHLRNGDRVTGTILTEETNQVTLKTTWWNVVVIPTAQIKSREVMSVTPGPPPALPPTPTQVVAKPPEAPAKPKAPKYWTGEALLGTDLLFSESRRQLYTGKLK